MKKKYLFYEKRNINMEKIHIQYNCFADFMSNCLLPFIIPFINIFIILNSESIVDAILNCMAIFFIIQIDEDIYQLSDYKIEQQSINFVRWFISTIYCKHIPEFEQILKYECNNWQTSMKKFAKKFRKSKIHPADSIC